jgi:lysophospholipase L1-like esterase
MIFVGSHMGKSGNSSNLRNIISLGLLILVSLTVGTVLGEIALRMAANKIDFLAPQMDLDEIQGYKIAAGSAGHDEWGFRNPRVPKKADIVTIGDSQTYGDGANHKGSWPAILGRMTGKTVYNMSLGGYGPTQYSYLLQNYALQLNPEQVIIGFYCGNDFMNAFDMVYGYDYWKELRDSLFTVDSSLHDKAQEIIAANRPVQFAGLRGWLRSHSVLYRFLSIPIQTMRLGSKKGWQPDPRFTLLDDQENHMRTGFKPVFRHQQSDVNDKRIQEGARLSFILLDRMNRACRARGIKFSLVLIPTKERVFARFIEHNASLKNSSVIDQVIASDRILRERVMQYCQERGIPFADPLQAMVQAAGGEPIYHNDLNDHPSAVGYAMIAEAVNKELLKTP